MDICNDCTKAITDRPRRGRCDRCYRRHLAALKAAGVYEKGAHRPMRRKKPLASRLFGKVTPGWGGCWIYTGWVDEEGYGRVTYGDRKRRAHRVAYELAHGSVPEGLEVDHTCHGEDLNCAGGDTCIHRRCINPNHLEAVTGRVNTLRSRSLPAQNALKTHCVHGHAFTPENTWLKKTSESPRGVKRVCLICKRERARAYNRARRARARGA